MITWIKLKALISALESIDNKKLVDVIEDFGKREFGSNYKEYLDRIRRKLATIVQEMGKRL